MNLELAIEINGLIIRHDSQWVLNDFCLQLRPGEKVTLTGPSGCGKSTVLRCILGLVIPDSGSISVMGNLIDAHTIWKARQDMTYVAQEPDLGSGSVGEIIEKPFSYRANIHLRDNLDRLAELMDRFNLPETIKQKQMSALSGGEKQRIALVTAILLDRRVFLLDEASSALDKKNKQAVADYFQQAKDTTVLSVSHDVEWLGFSNRVVDMAKANISEGVEE
jgi:putative ABC transport system ATP-binding protein